MLRLGRSLVFQCGRHMRSRRCHGTLPKPETHVHTIEEVEVLPKPEEKLSERYSKFREKLQNSALAPLPEVAPHPAHEKEPLVPWPNGVNPHTGEVGGPAGPEPTRYGDWERKGRVTDF